MPKRDYFLNFHNSCQQHHPCLFSYFLYILIFFFFFCSSLSSSSFCFMPSKAHLTLCFSRMEIMEIIHHFHHMDIKAEELTENAKPPLCKKKKKAFCWATFQPFVASNVWFSEAINSVNYYRMGVSRGPDESRHIFSIISCVPYLSISSRILCNNTWHRRREKAGTP